MVSVPRPSKTLLFVLLVGLTFAAVPFVVTSGDGAGGRSYEATAFDPETEAHVLAHRANDVDNLTAAADTNQSRRALERATSGEAVTVDDESEIEYLERHDGYAVYRGEYYLVNATENESAGTVTIRLDARTPEAAMADLAVPYDAVSPDVQRVVDRGNGTVESDDDEAALDPDVPPVVERNGTYHALSHASLLEVLAPFVRLFVLSLFAQLGNVYLGTALGVLGATVVAGRRRALGLRSATAVAAVGALAHGVLAMLVRSPRELTASPVAGDLPPLAVGVLLTALSGFALAATIAVGVGLRPSGSTRRLVAAVGIAVGAVLAVAAASAVTTGVAFAAVSTVFTTSVFVAAVGLPLVALGYVHGDAPERKRSGDGTSGDSESLAEGLET